jgi:hypothetical protein
MAASNRIYELKKTQLFIEFAFAYTNNLKLFLSANPTFFRSKYLCFLPFYRYRILTREAAYCSSHTYTLALRHVVLWCSYIRKTCMKPKVKMETNVRTQTELFIFSKTVEEVTMQKILCFFLDSVLGDRK